MTRKQAQEYMSIALGYDEESDSMVKLIIALLYIWEEDEEIPGELGRVVQRLYNDVKEMIIKDSFNRLKN